MSLPRDVHQNHLLIQEKLGRRIFHGRTCATIRLRRISGAGRGKSVQLNTGDIRRRHQKKGMLTNNAQTAP
jgi:hypothetical protein